MVFLDGAYHEQGDALVGEQLGHLQSREVGRVLERALRRTARSLRRHGALGDADEGEAEDADAATDAPEKRLVASAVSGQAPPAGPQWQRGLSPLRAPAETAAASESPPKAPTRKGIYRPWAELLRRTFGIDVLGVPQSARAHGTFGA